MSGPYSEYRLSNGMTVMFYKDELVLRQECDTTEDTLLHITVSELKLALEMAITPNRASVYQARLVRR